MSNIYAIIDENNFVVATTLADDNFVVPGHVVIQTDQASVGDQFVDGIIIKPTESFEETKQKKLNQLSDQLSTLEAQGVSYNGNMYATDKDSQVKYLAILLASMMDPSYNVKFKTLANTYVDLNVTQIRELCDAVKLHVQQCFDRDALYTQQIMAAQSKEELDAIDLAI